MSREKQIEEIAKICCDICEFEKCGKCLNNNNCDIGECYMAKHTAEKLYNAGYRKQSENEVEIVRCKDCKYWTEVSFDAITEWHWGECRKPLGDYRDCDTAEHDFCSYGEAKMKGGAE